jgi:nucleoside phosphorylase/CheY-like chemotaxis protein
MIVGIVDDDRAKRSELVRLVREAGGDAVQIRECISKVSARRLLRSEKLDLLILDIALPELDDGDPVRDGGIALLDEVIASSRFRMPTQVIGVTAREDVYEVAAARFGSELWSVLPYGREGGAWTEQLAAKVRHILRVRSLVEIPSADYDLGIVVALGSPELEAVLALPWGWSPTPGGPDPTVYHCGEFQRRDGTMGRAVVARAGQMGMPAATAVATKMGVAYNPRVLAMTGICAGNKGDTAIGDLVVANPTWDYGSGKYVSRNNEEVFEPAPYPLALTSRVRGIVERFEGESELLTSLRSEFGGAAPANVPRLHIGPFASGAAVVARAALLQQVQLQHRKLLAIDMEAFGVATAAAELPLPTPECLVLKGVSDFADEEKGDSQRNYAAFLSARMLAALCTAHGLC